MKTPRLFATLCVLLLLGACSTSSGAGARTVLVDFNHDEFASLFMKFFPAAIDAHPGDELVFKQAWTGDAHTVTGGTLADAIGVLAKPILEAGEHIAPFSDDPVLQEAMTKIGSPFGEDGLNQSAAQPCYMTQGSPPKDGSACRQVEQPTFNGRQSVYSSGLIPYAGPQGNEHRVPLADDIEPGTYFFFCLTHGPGQSTYVNVKPTSQKVQSAEAVSRDALREIETRTDVLLPYYKGAVRDETVSLDGQTLRAPFAGLWNREVDDSFVNEFVPRELTVARNEPVTWTMLGPPHTISFNVPRYLPIVTFEADGRVVSNPRVYEPSGGAPPLPSEGSDMDPILKIDGGTYDGEGFWSTGSITADRWVEYTLRFSKAGTYKYACLVHPRMVGTLTVR